LHQCTFRPIITNLLERQSAGAHLNILCRDDLPSPGVQGRVHINSEVKLQKAPKTFQDASIQILVVLLFEEFLQAYDMLRQSLASSMACTETSEDGSPYVSY